MQPGLSRRSLQNTSLRKLVVLTWHAHGIYVTFLAAFLLRFDGSIPLRYQVIFWQTIPILLPVGPLVFAVFNLLTGLWAYFSLDDVLKMAMAIFFAFGISALVVFASRGWGFEGIPRLVFMLEFLLLGLWMGGTRFALRYGRQHWQPYLKAGGQDGNERILVVGAIEDPDLLLRGTHLRVAGRFVQEGNQRV